MIRNETLLQKADLALSDLTAGGGLLQPAQADKFMRILIDESVVLKEGTVVPMKSHKQEIDKIRFGSRVLREATSATALTSGQRVKPDLSKVELSAKLFRAEVRLNDEVLEDSVERGTLRQTVMTLLSERVGLDMDEWIVNANTSSSDTFLATGTGMIAAATSNTTAFGGNTASQQAFSNLLKTMPTPFLRDRKSLRFYTSVDAVIDYVNTLSERATALGDRFTEQNVPQTPFGITLREVPVFPQNLGSGTDETVILLTDPKNIQIGIWRKVKIETDKDVAKGELIVVLSLRFDFQFAHEPAVAKATGVKAA